MTEKRKPPGGAGGHDKSKRRNLSFVCANDSINPKVALDNSNGSNEPVYVPDWKDLEERSQIMIAYWQSVVELAKIEQAMERLGIGGIHE